MRTRSDGVAVVAGEALVDLALGSDGKLSAHLGGGPYNVARTVGRLSQPVSYLGRLSRDGFGARLRDRLAQDGVGLDAIVDTDDPTTLAVVDLDAERSASYRFYTAGTAAEGLRPESALRALPPRVAILHVGTLGLVLEPIADAIEALVREADDQTLVIVDPNCRPSAIHDEAAYRARLRRILARADVLKVSQDDLEWLAPAREPIAAARALMADGPALALITCGSEGAIVVTETKRAAVPAPAVEVVDTVGAGDAFGGAFVAWWQAHALGRTEVAHAERAVEATRFACLVAAHTCKRAGAVPPLSIELRSGGSSVAV